LKLRAECTVMFGEVSLTFDEAEIEVLDKEEGNKFLEISLKDNRVGSKLSLVISTNDLKRILEAAEGGWEETLEKAIQELDKQRKDELTKTLREHGYDEKTIQTVLKWYGLGEVE